MLGAQALYISQPFLGGKQWNAFAHMLEEDEEIQAFARYLTRRGVVMIALGLLAFGSSPFAGAHTLETQVTRCIAPDRCI